MGTLWAGAEVRSEGTFPLNAFSFGKLSTQQKKRGQEIIHEGWELSPTKMECPIVWEAHAACSFPPGSEFSLPLPNSVLFLFNMSGGLCCVGWVFFVCVCVRSGLQLPVSMATSTSPVWGFAVCGPSPASRSLKGAAVPCFLQAHGELLQRRGGMGAGFCFPITQSVVSVSSPP